jgi:hypothetical protein
MKLKKIGLRISSIVLFLFIAGYDMTMYEFTEQFAASEIVFKKLLIPIILISIISSVLVIRYSYLKGKLLRSKIIDYFRAFWLLIVCLGGISLLTFALFQGSVLMTNRIFGEQKNIEINGKITDLNDRYSRDKSYFYIDVRDKNINRNISLRVNSRYKIGEDFKMQMKIGCLGLIYKK